MVSASHQDLSSLEEGTMRKSTPSRALEEQSSHTRRESEEEKEEKAVKLSNSSSHSHTPSFHSHSSIVDLGILEETTSWNSSDTNVGCCCPRQERPTKLACMVILLGLAATAAFTTLGITSAISIVHDQFEQSTTLLVNHIEMAWKDYVTAALWVHQACTVHKLGSYNGSYNRSYNGSYNGSYNDTTAQPTPNTTQPFAFAHTQFRELYEQLVSLGLDVQIEFLPNVTHAEREAYEAETRAYYAHRVPEYQGFVGLEPHPETGEYDLRPRSDADFYFPIHFIEPLAGSEPALDLDVYSRPRARFTIDKALQTFQPTLSEPARLVEETVDHANAVFLFHPGTPLSTRPNLKPRDLSLLVIRIPDLIQRATTPSVKTETISVYLYDTTHIQYQEGEQVEELFLGGVQIHPGAQTQAEDSLLAPIPLEQVRSTRRLMQERTLSIADREWTIAVVANKGTNKPDLLFVLIGSGLLVLCSLLISAWVYVNIRYSNMRKKAKMREIRLASETEKAALVLENARQATRAERTLNDFIAHEVRNPCSAAISACSFVRAAVQEEQPLVTDAARQAVRDDVEIIDNSLNFINDLLRNMLDMHRASSNQLKIETRLTCLYNDVLKPVDSMLYRRGKQSAIQFQVCCDPPNLIADTDPLRLKQIMLNLGRNSSKFVERGFVRLQARVVEGKVQLSVEDSGPGIPAHKRDHLFAKFQESLDSLNQGTGIGLYLCKKLVKLMNGKLWLDETYHSGIDGCPGTRFVIDLDVPPVSLEEVEARHPSILEESSSTTEDTPLPEQLSVLFVDDDLVVRKLFSRSIQKVGPTWNIKEASNGEMAIQMASKDHFDLIFVDQYMASVDKQLLGTETVRELRTNGVTCTICGFSANDMHEEFVNAGADTFLIKPFPARKDLLEKELKRVLASGKR